MSDDDGDDDDDRMRRMDKTRMVKTSRVVRSTLTGSEAADFKEKAISHMTTSH